MLLLLIMPAIDAFDPCPRHSSRPARPFVIVLLAILVTLGPSTSAVWAGPAAVDLGTLGGTFSSAYAVNANGQVVGDSTTAGDVDSHAFSWTAAGGMVDLGTLGGTASGASAVNASGQVVGASATAGEPYHCFSWTAAGGMVDLGSLPGLPNCFATAVNDSGQVIGQSWCDYCGPDANSLSRAFFWTQSGGMVDIGNLGGSDMFAVAINATGQVVGYGGSGGPYHAFSWTSAGGMIDLGALGPDGDSTMESGQMVNDSGQVVMQGSTGLESHAFSWTAAGGMVDLGTLSGGHDSDAFGVSSSGQVVGNSSVDVSGSIYHAFSWTASGGMVDLGTLSGDTQSGATAANASGQVVGDSSGQDGGTRAFAWTAAGGMIGLGILGGGATVASAMNDGGQVVGGSTTVGGETHAVLWQLDNTPAGHDVAVSPKPGITLTFSTVSTTGATTANATPNGPAPQGFNLNGAVYDVGTTAAVSGPITVCLPYSPGADPVTLSLLHYENGSWRDVTTTRDTVNRVICGQVTSLSPFAVGRPVFTVRGLVGLKNSDDVGIRFDLRAEVYRNGSELVGSADLASVAGGSSGFNNAKADVIEVNPATGVTFNAGDTLSIKLLIRNACTGSGKNSGTARLWYNDTAANTSIAAILSGQSATYYFKSNSGLGRTLGAGPKSTNDVAAGTKCSAYKTFGTWSTTLP